NWTLSAVLALALVAPHCATTSPLARQQCNSPDAELATSLRLLEEARAKGCNPTTANDARSACDYLRAEIERLAVVCPTHVPTLMANAVIAYDDHRTVVSQQYLDQILSEAPSHPDAAALRARIAMEEGNVPFARRLMEQQIALSPG